MLNQLPTQAIMMGLRFGKVPAVDRNIEDDEVLEIGGTIALHAARGDALRIVCVTDGSSTQYPDDPQTRERKARERRPDEAGAAGDENALARQRHAASLCRTPERPPTR